VSHLGLFIGLTTTPGRDKRDRLRFSRRPGRRCAVTRLNRPPRTHAPVESRSSPRVTARARAVSFHAGQSRIQTMNGSWTRQAGKPTLRPAQRLRCRVVGCRIFGYLPPLRTARGCPHGRHFACVSASDTDTQKRKRQSRQVSEANGWPLDTVLTRCWTRCGAHRQAELLQAPQC
jgi:hypothetical protein